MGQEELCVHLNNKKDKLAEIALLLYKGIKISITISVISPCKYVFLLLLLLLFEISKPQQ